MKILTPTPNIFLAEDDEDDAMLFSEALSEVSHNARLTRASNGQALLDLLDAENIRMPDFLFMDLNMPLRNGFECLADIRRRQEKFSGLKVVVLTTSDQADSIERVYGLGASRYVVKPNSFSGLKSVLAKVLETDWTARNIPASRKDFVVG